jgi:hypothetical protein
MYEHLQKAEEILQIRNRSEATPIIDILSSNTHDVILSHSSSLTVSPSCFRRLVQTLTAASAVVLASENFSSTCDAAASSNLLDWAFVVVREVELDVLEGKGFAGSSS